MDNILISPPVAFLIVLLTVLAIAHVLTRLSFKQSQRPADINKSYACGEDVATNLMQPDYSQFFPFAFFFTVLHVVALMITTVPVETTESLAIAVIYIAGALVGLAILFRR
jgi:NADH:ubiquinone oxidoreductase subunit 3 (subunit A)